MTTTSPFERRDSRQRVVLCGSMGALSAMHEIGQLLIGAGLEAVVPEPDVLAEHADPQDVRAIKREASLEHMRSIKDDRTVAVVVANVDRYGRRDYVGPNSFAEIAVAVSEDRPVFLLQGIPDDLRDELDAWQVRCLHGDLSALVKTLAPEAVCGGRSDGKTRGPDPQAETLFAVR